jgi:hypothetical protein
LSSKKRDKSRKSIFVDSVLLAWDNFKITIKVCIFYMEAKEWSILDTALILTIGFFLVGVCTWIGNQMAVRPSVNAGGHWFAVIGGGPCRGLRLRNPGQRWYLNRSFWQRGRQLPRCRVSF